MSERRTRARARKESSDKRSIPDWVWGAGLGAIVLVFIAAFFAFAQLSSGSSDPCDKALTALGTSTVDGPAFQSEDTSLGHMVDLLNQGDLNAANTIFYGPVHNFTHNVDPPIRAKDAATAKSLCKAVTKLEVDLTVAQSHATTDQLATETADIRNRLRDGAVVLGYPRPTD